jgi:hypothetical protein
MTHSWTFYETIVSMNFYEILKICAIDSMAYLPRRRIEGVTSATEAQPA